ncbi:DUF6992 family protein [Hymenobacter latericus]|uniref:DUF6992 family protein n=1 Tax=Hymenobacter sp. YIM 151858-1 TaxID=2987688 RepID=UPI0022262947|nr:hypothetical protein [Hymenobacter sp. YIM 151858-1]UYZ57938.1 hypothetical protein OIS50_12820 [Hymenobacter sp. YIM 151858-1]
MPDLPDVAAALPAINFQREMLAQQGMGVLGAWALLNLLGSGWLVTRTPARQAPHYFHQMNIGWGAVNACLAVWGILQARPLHVEGLTLADSLQAQFRFENILLFNAGLDVAYVAVGAWLHARAASAEHLPERYLGYARSLWVQGGFLLLFDVGFYLVYHRWAAALLALVP